MSDKLKNFIVRTLSGAVLLLVILGAMWVGYYGYLTLLLFITVAGTWEFYSLAKAKGYEPQRSLGVAMATLFYVAAAMISIMAVDGVKQFADNDTITLLVAILAIVIILFVAVVFVEEIFRNRTTPIANISTTIAGVGYVALPMALMTVMPMLIGGNGDWRAIYFLFYLFLVWGNDIFAYLAGVTMGRHKMCERLSPKKSWEGFVGGVLGSLAVGAVGAAVLDKSYVVWMGLALIVSLSSVVGDLVESMFKRDAGVKDSGNIIPGHGGILDRFDAFIISVPFAFVYILIVAII